MTDYKKILSIAWPLIISNSLWNMQMTIDRVFLGMYSTEALGAAMAVMGVFWVPMALLQQTASYVTTFVAQHYGARNFSEIGNALWNGIYVSIAGGLLFLFLIPFSTPFFSYVGHSDSLVTLEVAYFDSIAYSALPTAIMAAISGFYTGISNTRAVILINFVAMVSNAILDYVFIFGHFGFPQLGITGAGYATSLANYIGALYGIATLCKYSLEVSYSMRSGYLFKSKTFFTFLKYGIPSGFQWALEGLAFTTFLMILGGQKGGEISLSSSSIGMTVMLISVLPSMGIAQAVMTLVGQSIGEKQYQRAEKYTWKGIHLSFVYMLIIASTFVLAPEAYLYWFKNNQNPDLWRQVEVLSRNIFIVIAVFTLFDSIYLNLSFALKGAGDTRFVSLLSLVLPWPIMVLPTYFIRDSQNVAILGWCFVALYSILITFCLYFRFRIGAWKRISLV